MPGDAELLSTDRPRRRPLLLGLGAAVVGVLLVVVLERTSTPAGGRTAAPATSTGASAPAQPAAGTALDDIAAADLLTGSLPASGLPPSGAGTLQAARAVVNRDCPRIGTWVIEVLADPVGDSSDVVLLLTPAGPAYPSVRIQLRLTWTSDHYDWAAPREQLRSCP